MGTVAPSTTPSSIDGDIGHDRIVIIGGGVIGLSTAYSLALDLTAAVDASTSVGYAKPKITIIESSSKICPAASSHATGGIGDFGSKSRPSLAGLQKLSYNMHLKWAEEFNGAEKYGFTRQLIYRLTPKGFTGVPSPPDSSGTEIPSTPVPLSELPGWVRTSDDWEAQRLASGPQASQLDPQRFCPVLAERVAELGVEIELSATVTSVEMNNEKKEFSSVNIQREGGLTQTIPCRTVVLAAGPWSNRVFDQLFPEAKISIPMNATESAGNHFRVRVPGWNPESEENKKSVQVYYTNVTPDGSRFDVTSFANGDLYIGGWGAIPERIPDLATSVHAQPEMIKAMIPATKRYVKVDPDKDLDYFDVGRCYRPTTAVGRPIITKIDWDLLSKTSSSEVLPECSSHVSKIVGGLFINTGHGSSGVSQAPGSGKVVSDLVLGRTPSVDISGLGLPDQAHL